MLNGTYQSCSFAASRGVEALQVPAFQIFWTKLLKTGAQQAVHYASACQPYRKAIQWYIGLLEDPTQPYLPVKTAQPAHLMCLLTFSSSVLYGFRTGHYLLSVGP
jgi:hypothetical protein